MIRLVSNEYAAVLHSWLLLWKAIDKLQPYYRHFELITSDLLTL